MDSRVVYLGALVALAITVFSPAPSLSQSAAHRRWVAIGHDAPISDLQIAPNGDYFVSTDITGSRVIVWDAHANEYIAHIEGDPGHYYEHPPAIAISPDSRYLAIGDTALHIWEYSSRGFVHHLDVRPSLGFACIRFSLSGDSIAWLGYSRSDSVIAGTADLRSGQVVSTSLGARAAGPWDGYGRASAISSNLRFFAVAVSNPGPECVLVRDALHPDSLRRIDLAYIRHVVFYHGEDSLLIACDDSAFAVSVSDSKQHAIPLGFEYRYMEPDPLSEEAEFYMWNWRDSTVLRWSPAFGQTVFRVEPDPAIAYHIVGKMVRPNPASNGFYLASPLEGPYIPEDNSADFSGTIAFVQPNSSALVTRIDHGPSVARFSPNDSLIAIGSLGLSLLDRTGEGDLNNIGHLPDLDFNPTGELLAVAHYFTGMNDDPSTSVLRLADMEVIAGWRGGYAQLTNGVASEISFSPKDSSIVFGNRLLRFSTGSNSDGMWPNAPCHSTFHPDGMTYFAALGSRAVRYDAATGLRIDSFDTHFSQLNTIRCNRGGSMLLTAGDNEIKLWAQPSYALLQDFTLNHGRIGGARFSPDEKSIVAGCSDSSIVIIDAETGLERAVIKDFPAPYTDVEVSHDGKDILGLTPFAVIDYDSISVPLSAVKESGHESQRASLRFFPNPASDYVSIEADISHARLEILDALGRRVRTEVVHAGQDLNVADLPSGVYLCRILDGSRIVQGQLVIGR